MANALTIPLPPLPVPEALTGDEADRLAAYVGQAAAEAFRAWLLEAQVRRVFAEAKARGYSNEGAFGECGDRLPVSAKTARRIIEGDWARQPENRAA